MMDSMALAAVRLSEAMNMEYTELQPLQQVYSPSPEDYNHDPSRYPSPKTAGLYGEYPSSYPDGSEAGGWGDMHPGGMVASSYQSGAMLHGSSQYSQAPHYHRPHQQRPGGAGSAPEHMIYAPNEHQGGSSYGSNPSTPVSSPPPMSGSGGQWVRVSAGNNTSTSQPFESQLISLQSRMEERLDDAIYVLRNHAESNQLLPPGAAPPEGHPYEMGPGGHMAPHPHGSAGPGGHPLPHSNGLMPPGSYPTAPPHPHPAALDPHMHSSLSDERARSGLSSAATAGPEQTLASEQPDGSAVKVETDTKNDDVRSVDSDKSRDSTTSSTPALSKPPKSTPPKISGLDEYSTSSDEDDSPETKAERERVRRQANNARERVRVRDINEAFKELGRMCSIHMSADKPQTKLTVLQHAVSIITGLEQQVRERNLNPKAACLKRREEEKTEDLPGRGICPTSSDMSQHPMASTGKGPDNRAAAAYMDMGHHHL